MGGCGSGTNSTASMAIIASFSGSERDKYIGYIEAAGGAGLLFGPMMGAGLYEYGGYHLPFVTFGKYQYF